MFSSLLIPAGVIGTVVPGLVLGVYKLQDWALPAWLAVLLPVIFLGSLRGTLVLLGWKASRSLFRRWRASRE